MAAKFFISSDVYCGPLSDTTMEGTPWQEKIVFKAVTTADDVVEVSFCTWKNNQLLVNMRYL